MQHYLRWSGLCTWREGTEKIRRGGTVFRNMAQFSAAEKTSPIQDGNKKKTHLVAAQTVDPTHAVTSLVLRLMHNSRWYLGVYF